MKIYNFLEIEKKWQNYWLDNKTFKTTEDDSKPYFYALDMFPYPSGSGLHVGHPAGYNATDIFTRYKKMNGFNVLHAMGWDAFGLPSEQYAIATGNHPAKFTQKNINIFKEQLQLLGYSYDWDKEINTSDPEFYKTTQWIFQQFIKHDLAEIKNIDVNWCEALSTVLANDEIEIDDNGNSVSERGKYPVIKKPMQQWVIKSTAFVDDLLKGLNSLDWIESTKKIQQNFIKGENGKILLRDWTFSRQRYWGEPFPVIHGKNGEIQLINEAKLPLVLPDLDDFKGKDGKPALANSQEWLDNKYDLNTMPGSAGSSWYHLAYILKDENGYLDINSKEAKAKIKKWMPVDLYVGGTEHTTGHLIYARIWNIFLANIGVIDQKEPYQKLIHQGVILGPDGKKMSKSKGNVINPNDIIAKYGADTLRLYMAFMGPFEDFKPWSDDGLKGIHKWVHRMWRAIMETKVVKKSSQNMTKSYFQLIRDITSSIENNKFNVAISHFMVFINTVVEEKEITREQIKGFIQCLNPFAPHITEEMWEIHQFKTPLSTSIWPSYDEKIFASNTVSVAVMVNDKFKTKLELKKGLNEDQAFEILQKRPETKELVKEYKKVVYVQNQVINIVK